MLHALAIDGKGTERAGWPIDVTTSAPQSGGIAFTAPIQNQRAALALWVARCSCPSADTSVTASAITAGSSGDRHRHALGQVGATPAFAGGIWGTS